MSKNINTLAPSSYQIKVDVKAYAEDRIDYEKAIKYRCPNFLHKNGKIYASKVGEPYVAVTVSPYHINFQSQIEEPVWPVIKGLVDKGYLPVSSCGGHTDPWWEYYFMIAVGTEEQVEEITNAFNNVPNTHIDVYHSVANVHQYYEHGKFKYRPLDELEGTNKDEYRDLNILLNRNYSNYFFIRVRFKHETFALIFNPFNIFAPHFFHKREIEEFDLWKKNLLNYVENKIEYFYG
jgi:hypothetical protein